VVLVPPLITNAGQPDGLPALSPQPLTPGASPRPRSVLFPWCPKNTSPWEPPAMSPLPFTARAWLMIPPRVPRTVTV